MQRVAHTRAKHLSRVTPYQAASLLYAQVVLRFRLLSDAPRVSTIELPAETSRALFPLVHGGGRDTNSVVTVSQDSHPTRYNYNHSCKSRGVMWFF
jgi:hypothetical protein